MRQCLKKIFLFQIEVLETKVNTKVCELEEITSQKEVLEEKLHQAEKLSSEDKELLQRKLETVESRLEATCEVKEQLEIKLVQVNKSR